MFSPSDNGVYLNLSQGGDVAANPSKVPEAVALFAEWHAFEPVGLAVAVRTENRRLVSGGHGAEACLPAQVHLISLHFDLALDRKLFALMLAGAGRPTGDFRGRPPFLPTRVQLATRAVAPSSRDSADRIRAGSNVVASSCGAFASATCGMPMASTSQGRPIPLEAKKCGVDAGKECPNHRKNYSKNEQLYLNCLKKN